MQNILCSRKWNVFRKQSSLKYFHYDIFNKNDQLLKCCITNYNHLTLRSFSHMTLRQLQKKYNDLNSVFVNKGLQRFLPPKLAHNYNYLNLSIVRFKHGKSNNQSDDPKKDSNKNDDENLRSMLLKLALWIMVSYIGLIYFLYFLTGGNQAPEESPRFVSWNEFVHQMLAKGEVKELIIRPELDMVTIILHDGAIIKGKRSPFRSYHMIIPNSENLERKVREVEKQLGIRPEHGILIVYERGKSVMIHLITDIILTVVVLAILMKVFGGRARNFPGDIFSQMKQAKFTLIEPFTGRGKGVKFTDVAGLQEAKTEVMEFVDYLKNPNRYKKLGAKVPKGALLLGPPGCGKTLLAKAVATEASVPFLSMNGSEFIEVVGGLGAARVRDLFKEAKKRAPSIIYIDEIDAIGKKRFESGQDRSDTEGEQTLNQLLTEMDGMSSNEEVIVMASTNRAEVLDKALLRPGRFDRHILIDLPTLAERKEIFETHLKSIKLEHKPSVYSHRLAYLTPGFSGADIANVCNEAALYAAREKKLKVSGDDLLYAVDRTIAGIEKRSNTIAPSEKKVIAYHEAGHALVGWLLEHTEALLKVTIVPRTNRALGFSQFTNTEQKLLSKEQLFEKMCMALGGRVAESLTFNKISTGAQNDLEKITKIAYAQVQQFGMDPHIGLISFHPDQTDTKTRKPYSKMLANLMDQEARNIITSAYNRTEQLILDNKEKLNLLAEELLKKETLTYEEVEKLIGPPPFGKKKLIESTDFEADIAANVPVQERESPSPPQSNPS